MTSPIPFLGAFGGGQSPSFNAPLITTLVPNSSGGDSTPTFTRATTAYVKDFEGVWRPVPSGAARFEGARMVRQWLVNSEVPSGVGSVTLTAGQSDPFGGTSAYKCVYAAAGSGHRFVYAALGSNPVGVTGTISVYMRGEVGGEQIKLWDGFVVQSAVTLTTDWKRYSFSVTTSASISVLGYANTGTPTIYIHAAQTEAFGSAIPSEYVSIGVLSAPYHGAGADGCKFFDTENGNTVTSNVVTEATGAAIADATLKGYLAEGQRQNRCLYSQDFTNAAWVSGGGGIAVTPDTAVAPDGTTTADTLTASGANATLIQDLGVVASNSKAGGLWLKRKTGTGNIDLTMDGGSTWTTQTISNTEWTICEKVQTLADEDFGIRIVTSGDEVYAWQAQVETPYSSTAPGISSPIPTTTAAVTRNTDSLTYTTAGNFDNVVGTFYAETFQRNLIAPGAMLIGSPSSARYPAAYVAGTLKMYDGVNNLVMASVSVAAGTPSKIAVSWGGVTYNAAIDGIASSSNPATFDGDWNFPSTFAIGKLNNDGTALFGTIRDARIWTKAFSNAQLESMTTP